MARVRRTAEKPKLRALPTWRSEVDESIVRLLSETLEDAKKGELMSVSILGTTPSGSRYFRSSKMGNFFEHLGHMTYALVELAIDKMREREE